MRYNGSKRDETNKAQCSCSDDRADIGANNCDCELWGVNQMVGKIMGLKRAWNVSTGNYPGGMEKYKLGLELMTGQEREV